MTRGHRKGEGSKQAKAKPSGHRQVHSPLTEPGYRPILLPSQFLKTYLGTVYDVPTVKLGTRNPLACKGDSLHSQKTYSICSYKTSKWVATNHKHCRGNWMLREKEDIQKCIGPSKGDERGPCCLLYKRKTSPVLHRLVPLLSGLMC